MGLSVSKQHGFLSSRRKQLKFQVSQTLHCSHREHVILVFLAQNEQSRSFCYSNADLRKGEEASNYAFTPFYGPLS